MNETKKNKGFIENAKEELKEFWSEHGEKIKIGAKCLGVGLAIGFIKGAFAMSKSNSIVNSELIKKIPYEPDYDDFADYVQDHMDELKVYYEAEKEFNEES